MPGIVGFITKLPREQAEPQLVRMVELLRHEPFYSTGTWIDESLGVYLGWVARKNSFSECMPLFNERNDIILVFSGEEFPEPGTANRLKERGHTLDMEGPSYLVHLYEEAQTFPVGLNGQFHGLLMDLNRGTAMLFNDRYGLHRIFYHEAKEAFYFASEAKSILGVCAALRTADIRGLGEFVTCGCVLENRTLFKGIHVLPPAASWVFQGGYLQQRGRYFNPQDWEDQSQLEPESYYKEVRDVFFRNLSRYFEGRERIGISLTGGLDTRMIMAWHKAASGYLPCYTFGGMFRDSRDVYVAREVARACGQPHMVIPLGEEFLTRFPHYAERAVYLTDGSTSVSHSPDLYVNEIAREIAPVRMTGNYGDEVLRRIRVFKPVHPSPGLFSYELMSQVHTASQTYAGLIHGHPLTFAVFQQGPWHHSGLLALEQTQLSMRTPYLDNDLVCKVFRAPQSAYVNNDLRVRLIEEGNPVLTQIPTDLGYAGNLKNSLGVALRKYHLFTHKAEYAFDYGMPHWLARIDRFLLPFHLERLFLGRHKFYHFRLWYRDALSDYIREMLLDRPTLSRPYLERKGLEAMVRDHLEGGRNYTIEIHKVLTLELLHRLFLDSK